MRHTFREYCNNFSNGQGLERATEKDLIVPYLAVHRNVSSIQEDVFRNRMPKQSRFRPVVQKSAMGERGGYTKTVRFVRFDKEDAIHVHSTAGSTLML